MMSKILALSAILLVSPAACLFHLPREVLQRHRGKPSDASKQNCKPNAPLTADCYWPDYNKVWNGNEITQIATGQFAYVWSNIQVLNVPAKMVQMIKEQKQYFLIGSRPQMGPDMMVLNPTEFISEMWLTERGGLSTYVDVVDNLPKLVCVFNPRANFAQDVNVNSPANYAYAGKVCMKNFPGPECPQYDMFNGAVLDDSGRMMVNDIFTDQICEGKKCTTVLRGQFNTDFELKNPIAIPNNYNSYNALYFDKISLHPKLSDIPAPPQIDVDCLDYFKLPPKAPVVEKAAQDAAQQPAMVKEEVVPTWFWAVFGVVLGLLVVSLVALATVILRQHNAARDAGPFGDPYHPALTGDAIETIPLSPSYRLPMPTPAIDSKSP